MHRLTLAIITLFPVMAQAQAVQRPIPDAQSAAAHWWFLGASIALVISLVAVHLLVRRR